jgi:prepilin-type N-terminal cleavage/methylation domain-containing protein
MKKNGKPAGHLDNKGFSLMELIVVIVIMAILGVVLAPQFIRYVEQSRVAKDEASASEILRAVQIAVNEPDVYEKIIAGDTAVEISWEKSGDTLYEINAVGSDEGDTALKNAVISVVGSSIERSSKTHSNDVFTVIATPDDELGIVVTYSDTSGEGGIWARPKASDS